MLQLELNDIYQRYAIAPVVNGVSFSLASGQIACLLGPSGCGKTTLLRCIAGFEQLTAGKIHINGQCVSSTSFKLPPEKRRIGMVFQDYALFPHLNVRENIGFGLSTHASKSRQARISELLTTVGLEGEDQSTDHQSDRRTPARYERLKPE